MDRKQKGLILIALGIALLLPAFGYAQDFPSSGAGLVPCGVTTDANPNVATECQACHLVELTQNVINFVIGLAISIAILLVAWGGILYFTSRADPAQIEKAKRVFRDTLIGFLIAISAWIVVNTTLFALLDSQQFPESSWFDISCVSPNKRPINVSVSDIIKNALGVVDLPEGRTIFLLEDDDGKTRYYQCPTMGYEYNAAAGVCVNEEGDMEDYTRYTPSVPQNGALPLGYCGNGTDTGSIAACAQLYTAQEISSANCSPYVEGGNKACACMVNKILESAGYAPIDGDSVALMQSELRAGAGTPVTASNTRPGDIVIWKNSAVSHVGICANVGCTQTYANSSSNARMQLGGNTVEGYAPTAYYRVN